MLNTFLDDFEEKEISLINRIWNNKDSGCKQNTFQSQEEGQQLLFDTNYGKLQQEIRIIVGLVDKMNIEKEKEEEQWN